MKKNSLCCKVFGNDVDKVINHFNANPETIEYFKLMLLHMMNKSASIDDPLYTQKVTYYDGMSEGMATLLKTFGE